MSETYEGGLLIKRLLRKPDSGSGVYEEAFSFSRELPAAKKVLVLAAHPDDETLGCGGTILRHKKAGAEVNVLALTDGGRVHYTGREDIRLVRKKEAQAAGEILRIDKIQFLDIPDMELQKNIRQASAEVFSFIDKYRPDLVYAPSPVDFHPDHRAVSGLAMEIVKKGIRTAFYEIYMPVRFNMLIDITEVMPLKEKAISSYVHSLLGKPRHFVKAIRGLNAYRCFLEAAADEDRFCEAFFVADKHWRKSALVKWLTYSL